jgi:transcriptional regulator with XRE-family HTH domain
MTAKTNIAGRLRRARRQAGLTQADLALLCGMTQATVQKIEAGHSTNSRFLPKIWAQLNQPLNELGIVSVRNSTIRAEAARRHVDALVKLLHDEPDTVIRPILDNLFERIHTESARKLLGQMGKK